jgi:hypothetical protein
MGSLGAGHYFTGRGARCWAKTEIKLGRIPHLSGSFSAFILGWRTGNTACQKMILPDNENMSAQEILIEEIRHKPEPLVREVLHYMKFLERQREEEAWSDVLPSREVEQEKLDILVADTWEKLGPAPEIDYAKL